MGDEEGMGTRGICASDFILHLGLGPAPVTRAGTLPHPTHTVHESLESLGWLDGCLADMSTVQ